MTTEEQKVTQEDLLGPPKMDIIQVGLTAIGSIIAGFVGSIIILLAIYFLLQGAKGFDGVYAYIYISTATAATLVTAGINGVMNKIIHPEKYKRGSAVFAQSFLLTIFIFVILIFGYVFVASKNISYLIYLFTIHITIAMLGYSLIGEILSGYRYALLGIYGSFVGTIFSILLTSIAFLSFGESNKNLYILILLLIVINFATNTLRALFEYLYYVYYSSTGMDQLGDIYEQIETEEKEILEKAKKELETFK